MKHLLFFIAAIAVVLFSACTDSTNELATDKPVYKDVVYQQDLSIKFYTHDSAMSLNEAFADRNGVIQVMSSAGILRPYDGQFLYPGTLEPDKTYRPLTDKKIVSLKNYDNQFVYLDDKAVLSNAWAGKLFIRHNLPDAKLFAGGKDFSFLISNGKSLEFLANNQSVWQGQPDGDEVRIICYDPATAKFWILGKSTLSYFDPAQQQLTRALSGENYSALAITEKNLVVGTSDGYFLADKINGAQSGESVQKLPWTDITAIEEIDGNLWFGTTKGAFMQKADGKFNYYFGERWLPGNIVVHIAKGPEQSVLITTNAGLAKIEFRDMTLYDKAVYYEAQVRDRHIRHGFNASLDNLNHGDLSTGRLSDSDNDGLWTSMYLAGEAFRYAVTKSDDALQNVRESLDAMDRLYTVNPVPGFPSRSFERSGYIERLSDPERWQHSEDPEWDWKATTSSDEAIGHIFAFGVIAEIVENEALKNQAVQLIDTLMSHIVKNDMYMIDFDGKPTTWGRWNPEYVNARPIMVGDRKINASNIIGMLQTAYHFTGKEKYKDKAFELMTEHGYYENLMRPMSEIGRAPEDADEWSKMLSADWNHSDDEMYFVGYWGLYNYAFNDTLKENYKKAIIDHWESERPEKEGAWNIMTALTGTAEFDLQEAAWYLREHPMDLIDWSIMNSHRKDIEFIEPNFRNQTIKEVLPPDERPVQRHNGNMFNLDRPGRSGVSEHSAGDIWLLPYWMGRYLGVISEPQH